MKSQWNTTFKGLSGVPQLTEEEKRARKIYNGTWYNKLPNHSRKVDKKGVPLNYYDNEYYKDVL